MEFFISCLKVSPKQFLARKLMHYLKVSSETTISSQKIMKILMRRLKVSLETNADKKLLDILMRCLKVSPGNKNPPAFPDISFKYKRIRQMIIILSLFYIMTIIFRMYIIKSKLMYLYIFSYFFGHHSLDGLASSLDPSIINSLLDLLEQQKGRRRGGGVSCIVSYHSTTSYF